MTVTKLISCCSRVAEKISKRNSTSIRETVGHGIVNNSNQSSSTCETIFESDLRTINTTLPTSWPKDSTITRNVPQNAVLPLPVLQSIQTAPPQPSTPRSHPRAAVSRKVVEIFNREFRLKLRKSKQLIRVFKEEEFQRLRTALRIKEQDLAHSLENLNFNETTRKITSNINGMGELSVCISTYQAACDIKEIVGELATHYELHSFSEGFSMIWPIIGLYKVAETYVYVTYALREESGVQYREVRMDQHAIRNSLETLPPAFASTKVLVLNDLKFLQAKIRLFKLFEEYPARSTGPFWRFEICFPHSGDERSDTSSISLMTVSSESSYRSLVGRTTRRRFVRALKKRFSQFRRLIVKTTKRK